MPVRPWTTSTSGGRSTWSVDKQALVQAVTSGLGQVPNSYIPHGALFHADIPGRPHDPAAAKAMLAAAGAPGLKLSYVYNAGNEVEEQIAVLLQQQLKQADITLDLRKVDPANFWSELEAGNFDRAGRPDQRQHGRRPEDDLRPRPRQQHELHDPLPE